MHRQLLIAEVVGTALVLGAAVVTHQQPTSRPSPAPAAAPAAQQANKVVVYKSPTCGCCGAWVDYMRANGFTVEVHDQADVTPIKRGAGVPVALESCHTAQIGGYAIEGHVPVSAIRKMLRERPAIAGLAVAGMVAGTPGMEMGNQHPPYEVTSFTREGRTAVYERH
jgi:hypothetical protein